MMSGCRANGEEEEETMRVGERSGEDGMEMACEEEEELDVNVLLDPVSFSTITTQSVTKNGGKNGGVAEVDLAVSSTSRYQSTDINSLQIPKIAEVPSAAERFSQLLQGSQLLNPSLFKQIPDFDPEIFPEKPWAQPGENLSDYFNYGFTPETYQAYIQRKKSILEFNSRGEEKNIPKHAEGSHRKRRDRDPDRRHYPHDREPREYKNGRDRGEYREPTEYRPEKGKKDQKPDYRDSNEKDARPTRNEPKLDKEPRNDPHGDSGSFRNEFNANGPNEPGEPKNWEISKNSTNATGNRPRGPASDNRIDERENRFKEPPNNRKERLNPNRHDNGRSGDHRHDSSSKDYPDRIPEKIEPPPPRSQKDRRYDPKPEFGRNKRSRDRNFFEPPTSDRKRRK